MQHKFLTTILHHRALVATKRVSVGFVPGGGRAIPSTRVVRNASQQLTPSSHNCAQKHGGRAGEKAQRLSPTTLYIVGGADI